MSSVKRKGKNCGNMGFSSQVGEEYEIKQDWIKVKRTKILCSISDTRSSGTDINGKLGFAIKIARRKSHYFVSVGEWGKFS